MIQLILLGSGDDPSLLQLIKWMTYRTDIREFADLGVRCNDIWELTVKFEHLRSCVSLYVNRKWS